MHKLKITLSNRYTKEIISEDIKKFHSIYNLEREKYDEEDRQRPSDVVCKTAVKKHGESAWEV